MHDDDMFEELELEVELDDRSDGVPLEELLGRREPTGAVTRAGAGGDSGSGVIRLADLVARTTIQQVRQLGGSEEDAATASPEPFPLEIAMTYPPPPLGARSRVRLLIAGLAAAVLAFAFLISAIAVHQHRRRELELRAADETRSALQAAEAALQVASAPGVMQAPDPIATPSAAARTSAVEDDASKGAAPSHKPAKRKKHAHHGASAEREAPKAASGRAKNDELDALLGMSSKPRK